MSLREIITGYLDELKSALNSLKAEEIERAVEMIWEAYERGGTIFVIGNGGSASTAAHFACDLGKGTSTEGRERLRVLSLADNIALLTAWANDTSYEEIFVQQLRNLMRPGDLLIAISASGNSPNVLRAAEYAKSIGCPVLGLTGFGGGKLAKMADHSIVVASDRYGPVEDIHLVLDHIFARCIRAKLSSPR
ncbi:phosphoheptose isomerase [Candidatus Poribacteria bacterium]|nr:MAG: phosphoheptose isomerase [Candidatus Poribacteria bacterium]